MEPIRIGNVDVVVRTRDEHCPPHVHADCTPEGWDARFKFGFTSDDVVFWDFRPDNPQKAPNSSRLNDVGEAIFQNLVTVRQRWWEVMGSVCLDNLYIHHTQHGIEVVKDKLYQRGLPQVQLATYDPITRIVAVLLTDKSSTQYIL